MSEELNNLPDKQESNRDNLGRWRPGFSGNLNGRKPGKSLKEFSKDYLAKLTDKEKDDWLAGLPREIIWRMAEGQPKQDTELSGEVKTKIVSIDE